jgi:hypothetical protein
MRSMVEGVVATAGAAMKSCLHQPPAGPLPSKGR